MPKVPAPVLVDVALLAPRGIVMPAPGDGFDLLNPIVQMIARDVIGRAVLGLWRVPGAEQFPISGILVEVRCRNPEPHCVMVTASSPVNLGARVERAIWRSSIDELPGFDPDWFNDDDKAQVRLYALVLGALLTRASDSSATWGPVDESFSKRVRHAALRRHLRYLLVRRAWEKHPAVTVEYLSSQILMQPPGKEWTGDPPSLDEIRKALRELLVMTQAVSRLEDGRMVWSAVNVDTV